MSTGSPATAPATPPVLEFASLPQRHPTGFGVSLLHAFAPSAAVRLAATSGDTFREITVRWRPRDGRRRQQELTVRLDWSGCLNLWADSPESLVAAVPEQDRTEYAAVAVMAILVGELEEAQVVETLDIGSGGDYNVLVMNASFQIEVSGIEADMSGHETAKRVRTKSSQVLKRQKRAFASVTTFDFKTRGVYSQLLFVRK